MDSPEIFWELATKNGPLYGFFLFVLYIFAQQIYNHREAIWKSYSYAAWLFINLIGEHIRTRNARFIRKVAQNVSQIYANLYELRYLSPIRVHVAKYIYTSSRAKDTSTISRIGIHKGQKQVWRCYIMHELHFSGKPIRDFWQGIEIDAQHQEYLVSLIANEENGQLIMNVEEMADGDYKYSIMSEGAKTVFNIVLVQLQKVVWVLTVTLNREPPLEPEEVSQMKLHAKNIKRLL